MEKSHDSRIDMTLEEAIRLLNEFPQIQQKGSKKSQQDSSWVNKIAIREHNQSNNQQTGLFQLRPCFPVKKIPIQFHSRCPQDTTPNQNDTTLDSQVIPQSLQVKTSKNRSPPPIFLTPETHEECNQHTKESRVVEKHLPYLSSDIDRTKLKKHSSQPKILTKIQLENEQLKKRNANIVKMIHNASNLLITALNNDSKIFKQEEKKEKNLIIHQNQERRKELIKLLKFRKYQSVLTTLKPPQKSRINSVLQSQSKSPAQRKHSHSQVFNFYSPESDFRDSHISTNNQNY